VKESSHGVVKVLGFIPAFVYRGSLRLRKFLVRIACCRTAFLTLELPNESLTAEREQVRKIHNMSFRHLGILL
jgi:hypothetical protein